MSARLKFKTFVKDGERFFILRAKLSGWAGDEMSCFAISDSREVEVRFAVSEWNELQFVVFRGAE